MRDAVISPRTLTRADVLRARQPFFRRRVDEAFRRIEEALSVTGRPYVAFSGGKDSLVTLALASALRPGIDAIWCDHELEHEESVRFITAINQSLPVTLRVTRCYSTHAGWFVPWTQEPPFREPLPGTFDLGDSIRVAGMAHGWDGALLGLRAEESAYRRLNAARGPLYQVASGQWHCLPLLGWTVDDVWAFIAGWDLPYNPVYDVLTRIGVPRSQQRIGPLPLARGWELRTGWPVLYERLVDRYGPRW